MPRFELFVPAAPPAIPVDLTLRIDAESWLAALKKGLDNLGGPRAPRNVLCDVQADGSIHVTDAQGGGVFRIRWLVGAAPPAPEAAPAVGRPPAPRTPEEVLAELYERVSELDPQADRRTALAALLDLGMARVDCEAGSVFLAQPGRGLLEFAVARGPRAGEILDLGLTVPVGVGIVGFCVRENVGLAVSDAEKDPRFHRAVSLAIGYETRSLLCAPIARRGAAAVGALEVVNKRGGRPFARSDLAVLSYLAQHAAEVVARTGG